MKLFARNVKQLGEILRRLRRQNLMTQSALGEKTSLRQATISKIEKGEESTRLQTLFDVLTALDLELEVRPRTKRSVKDIEGIF
jgi:HTH-type transcriptional regulator / antitoxin HipB